MSVICCKKKKLLKIITIFILLGLTIFTYQILGNRNPTKEIALKLVEVEKVQLQDIQQTVRLIGTIKPKHVTVLVAKETGKLDCLIATGQKIKKGTLVAKIDNPDIENNHQLSEVAEKIAKTQYDRLAGLLKTGYVSAKEVEEKKQAWIEAQKNRSKTKIELDNIRFYAPFDGIIGAYKKREGTQINQGDIVVTIYDPSTLTVDFDIPCTNILSINEGQPVRVLQQKYKLSHIQRMIDEETHMCPADVDIICATCVIGSSVDVELITQEKKQVIVIPYQAVFIRDSKPFVYVVEKDKIALVAVTTGLQEKTKIEITQGLKPGQQLVIKGQERLYPTMQVGIYQHSSTTSLT